MRSTISALPRTNPTRQPAMPYVFDIDHISTPMSFAPGVARGERGLDDRSVGAGIERHLGLGVELDTVDVAITRNDCLPCARQPADRRVPVHVRLECRRAQRLDHVRGRPRLRIAAAEIDE